MSTEQSFVDSIQLPDTIIVFRNIKKAKRFAIDIGGSLTKIAYYSTVSYRKVSYDSDHAGYDEEGGSEFHHYERSEMERLHFVKFETKYIEQCLDFIRNHLVSSRESMIGKSIKATGGGAYKYAEIINQKLGLTVEKEDEICCLIKGCNFLLRNIPDEQFAYCKHEDPEYRFINSEPNIFPYLLVNIGSGVSIMKVEAEDKYGRIGGTSMGGGTFWGLGSLLTKASGFDDLLLLASEGDHRKVDLLVKDIYGGNYDAHGLSGDIIASSFGKAMGTQKDFSEADIARSLLFTVSNDIGQIASLYAMLHNLKKVYFGGYFLRNHPVSMHTLSYAIKYWSRGMVQALFLRHEGYLGAIGAFLKGAEECDADKYSWGENYAGSSGLKSPLPNPVVTSSLWASIDQLEMDRCDQHLTLLPLLARPKDYLPDTVDLILDREAREYWLSCFEQSLESFVERAIRSQPESGDAAGRAEKFRQKYSHRLSTLRHHPFAYGNLTVRSLLDMREHCLNEFDFPDPYLQQKKIENDEALLLLKEHLSYLDSLPWDARQEALVRGILAGNVFDWGAKEVVALMSEGGLSFAAAEARLQSRPWLRDDLSLWMERLKGPPHQCALFFLDNSGCDVVLGVIPFARELLARGTKVILCANSKPALNDVTAVELEVLLRQVASLCPRIERGLKEQTLRVLPSGQASPCLDLSRLPQSLVEEVVAHGCDLVVLEGMGRALHTNLNAKLTCDALKLAVIKNKWLAERHGGEMFAVMCRFEPRKASKTCSPERDLSGRQASPSSR